MSKIIRVKYNEGSESENIGAFLVFSYEEVDRIPEGLETNDDMAVILMNNTDLTYFLDDLDMEISDDDYRYIKNGTLDGQYIELTDLGFAYLKKNLNDGLFVYDPCGELEQKWNVIRFKKK